MLSLATNEHSVKTNPSQPHIAFNDSVRLWPCKKNDFSPTQKNSVTKHCMRVANFTELLSPLPLMKVRERKSRLTNLAVTTHVKTKTNVSTLTYNFWMLISWWQTQRDFPRTIDNSVVNHSDKMAHYIVLFYVHVKKNI